MFAPHENHLRNTDLVLFFLFHAWFPMSDDCVRLNKWLIVLSKPTPALWSCLPVLWWWISPKVSAPPHHAEHARDCMRWNNEKETLERRVGKNKKTVIRCYSIKIVLFYTFKMFDLFYFVTCVAVYTALRPCLFQRSKSMVYEKHKNFDAWCNCL